jgi:hypothetical protein
MFTDYTILTATKKQDLAELVKQAMANGWQPVGGVSAMTIPVNYDEGPKLEIALAQAMVK